MKQTFPLRKVRAKDHVWIAPRRRGYIVMRVVEAVLVENLILVQ